MSDITITLPPWLFFGGLLVWLLLRIFEKSLERKSKKLDLEIERERAESLRVAIRAKEKFPNSKVRAGDITIG